jgi:hypothetical protein|tara:strand:- start:149 stop:793 length:645 start_codon:yes stop_codon:yes gene_type:complete
MEENFDAFIFSCDWDNYQNNILHDKETMTVGMWGLDREKLKYVKYAYAYLTSSDKTVVKKFHIDKWEDAQKEKGYDDPSKMCFIFTQSEDTFFLWDQDPIQAPRYVSSVRLDNLPRMNQEQVDINLHKSEVTPKVAYYSEEGQKRVKEKKPRTSWARKRLKAETTRERLSKVYREKFKDKKIHDLSIIVSLEKEVEAGQEPEEVLTNYFNSLEK